LTRYSGSMIGAHQKIDRVARRHLTQLLDDPTVFPKARTIIQFEGRDGPDGLKLKSPGKDEPHQLFSPFDEKDTELPELIQGHYERLVQALKSHNQERVAFEAAWLSHGIVDGLTPAHHYPYEEKLAELLAGEGLESRNSILKKNIMPGETPREKLRNNWRMWGPRGLFLGHGLFEIGVATVIKPLTFTEAIPTTSDIEKMQEIGVVDWFKQAAREIGVLDMYVTYYQKGWTPKLAWQVRHQLGPITVKAVTLSWYTALLEAGIIDNDENNRR
jgi:hypothetical protein